MKLLIVGSIAIDSIKTPWGQVDGVLGGSATYAALAARLWTPIQVVGVIGTDFPESYHKILKKYDIDGDGLKKVPGRTFRWRGEYDETLQATTLDLDLGVFEHFEPVLSPSCSNTQYAFLGNIHPSLQQNVLKQLKKPKVSACDSRDVWIQNNQKELLALMKKVDIIFLNDYETRILTGIHNLVQATRVLARLGPKVAVVKKGEHGVLAATRDAFMSLPSHPVPRVIDPTGAGDAFAGACLGYLATQRRITWATFNKALQYASTVASLTIEAFGPSRLLKTSVTEVVRRTKSLQPTSQTVIL